MQVISLNSEGLKKHAEMLQEKCGGYRPDLVIGIANGGARLAQLIFPEIPHISIDCHRPSTSKKKNKAIKYMLSVLPYFVLDRMRMIESRILGQKRHTDVDAKILPAHLSDLSKAQKILLIDDAVDSGCTLRACTDKLRALSPTADIKTAAITITTKTPVTKPDIFIYDNLTLIRFPWSIDSKK